MQKTPHIDTETLFNTWPKTGTILLQYPLDIALRYVHYLLSDEKSTALLNAGTHTDFYLVEPLHDKKVIKIDQVRALIDWALGKPQIATQKVAVIAEAQLLNKEAANALLKTLEEPNQDTLFILVCDTPAFLLPTLKSRCYWIRPTAHSPSENSLDAFIEEARLVQSLHDLKTGKQDPIQMAAEWLQYEPKKLVDALLQVFCEILKQSNPSAKRLFSVIDRLFEAKRELLAPNPPNGQLLLESLLIHYSTYTNR